jgi:hypothetical protein
MSRLRQPDVCKCFILTTCSPSPMILRWGEALIAFVETTRISLIFILSWLEAYVSLATKNPYGE